MSFKNAVIERLMVVSLRDLVSTLTCPGVHLTICRTIAVALLTIDSSLLFSTWKWLLLIDKAQFPIILLNVPLCASTARTFFVLFLVLLLLAPSASLALFSYSVSIFYVTANKSYAQIITVFAYSGIIWFQKHGARLPSFQSWRHFLMVAKTLHDTLSWLK
jgi:hypothetical protein